MAAGKTAGACARDEVVPGIADAVEVARSAAEGAELVTTSQAMVPPAVHSHSQAEESEHWGFALEPGLAVAVEEPGCMANVLGAEVKRTALQHS